MKKPASGPGMDKGAMGKAWPAFVARDPGAETNQAASCHSSERLRQRAPLATEVAPRVGAFLTDFDFLGSRW